MTVILDTHVVIWMDAWPGRLSAPALRAVSGGGELAVAAITWWELAWLLQHGRLTTRISPRAWFADLTRELRTIPLTPAIAQAAAALPPLFPHDPIDRLIYATAVEHGMRLVTKDGLLHQHDPEGRVVLW